MTTLSPTVIVRDLSKSFGPRSVLRDIDLTMYPGEFVVLVGASGSGKTTLLRMLSGLSAPDGGEIKVPKDRTVVFQEPRLINSSRVWRNVVVGLRGQDASREVACAALTEVGLDGHEDDWPATLSGGEAQRVAIARALVRRPQLLLLDEPFAALDALTRSAMHALLARLCATHQPTTLLVTHDVDEAFFLADRIFVLRNGKLEKEFVISTPRPRNLGDYSRELRAQMLALLEVSLTSTESAKPQL